MKKRNLFTVLALVAALACVACTNKAADYTASSEEIVVPEDAELPTAAEAVEKIINDEDILDLPMTEEIEEEEDTEEPDDIEVVIYYVQGSYDEFKEIDEELPELTPDSLINQLSHHNIAPVDTKVEEFEQFVDDEGKSGLKLVLSSSFDTYLSTMSDDARKAIIASVSNTFLDAYDADYIDFLDIKVTWCDVPTADLEDEVNN